MGDERNVVTVDPKGRLTTEPGAERRLAPHAGTYRVVPTPNVLVVLQRLPDGDEAAKSGQVVLAGAIERAGGLVDILHFIEGNQWSGQLTVMNGAVRKAIYFRRGDVRTAASNVPDDRLGAILYRFGMVSEELLSRALEKADAPKLGQALVEMGAITPHDLYTYIRKQVEEIFYSVIGLGSGEFYFERTGDEEGPPSQLILSGKALLFEGVRRLDELAYFRERLPSNQVVLIRRTPAPSTKLTDPEQRLLDLVNGARDLGTLARLSHLGEFETTRVLYQLLKAGYVQPQAAEEKLEAKVSATRSIETVFQHVIDTFNDVYAKIHVAVAQKGRQEALRSALESFFSSAAEFAPLFVGVELLEDGTLMRDQLLSNLEIAPAENKLEYLHRGLKELLFYALFTAGEAVDRREEMELHQQLNQILADMPDAADAFAPEITIESDE